MLTWEEVHSAYLTVRKVAFEQYESGGLGWSELIEAARLLEIELRVLDEQRWQREILFKDDHTNPGSLGLLTTR